MDDALIPGSLIAFLAVVARLTLGSWMAPGALFALYMALLTFSSYVIPAFYPHAGGVWWILLSLLMFYLANMVVVLLEGRQRIERRPDPAVSVILPPRIRTVIVWGLLIGAVYVSIYQTIGVRTLQPPLWMQPIMPALYVTPVLGGMLFAAGGRRGARWLGLLTVIPQLTNSIAGTSSSGVLSAFAFWFSGYFCILIVERRGAVALVRPAYFALIAGLLVFFMLSMVVTRAMREAWYSMPDHHSVTLEDRMVLFRDSLNFNEFMDELPRRWEYMRHELFSHVYAFTVYFDQAWDDPPELFYGAYMFQGPLILLGIEERYGRLLNEPIWIDNDVPTNVFSIFRPPINDFGFVGSLVWWFGCGLAAGWAYRQLARGNLLPAPILVIFYTNVFMPGGYFFFWNVILLTHVLLALYLWWGRRTVVSCSARPVPVLPTREECTS